MTISVRWKDRKRTCIETRFEDPWTLDEFIEARKSWHRMIKSTDYRVPIILDLSNTVEPPQGVLRHFAAIHRTPHPRQGHIYVFGMSAKCKLLSKHLINGVVDPDKSVHIVDTLENLY